MKQHFCPAEKAEIAYQDKCNWCGELESQEPVAWRAPNWGHNADEYVYRDFDDPVIGVDGKPSPNNEPLYTNPPQRTEQNFCSRCGKRTADLTTIHTCTPPQD